ncbi:Serine_threonine-protein kinase PknD [Nocardiopsis dassonvillei]|uniref:serine/threonine-protein kinase n=1 Tax=Nocardiopsis dassonvillei TaxID=2014 RepID=UPI003F560227
MNHPPTHPPGAPSGVTPLPAGDPRTVGPFRIAGRLGAGGMGTVYAALDDRDRRAALKLVHAMYAADPDFRDRFAREVRLVRRVRAEGVPGFLAADTRADIPWLATEYVPGPTLDARVRGGGPLPPGHLADFARVTARALAAVHAAGVVHRDLKPGNVILSPDGPRILDFGIARAAEETALTRTGALVGTPGWISPEQYRGEAATDRSDVFAWACMVVFAATGRGPFGSGTTEGVVSAVLSAPPALDGVPAPLRPVLAAALDKDPARRPSAAEAAAALPALPVPAPWAAVLPPVDADPGSWARAAPPRRSWARRHGRVLAAAAAATALAVGVATASALLPPPGPGDGGPTAQDAPAGTAPESGTAGGEQVPAGVPEEYRDLYENGTVVIEAAPGGEPAVVRSLVGPDGTSLDQLRVTPVGVFETVGDTRWGVEWRVEYLLDFGEIQFRTSDFAWTDGDPAGQDHLTVAARHQGGLFVLSPDTPEQLIPGFAEGLASPRAVYYLPSALTETVDGQERFPRDRTGGFCFFDEEGPETFPGLSLAPLDPDCLVSP